MSQIFEQIVDGAADGVVHDPEIDPEQENRDNDHRRRGLHVFERGRGDLLHFRTHIVIKSLDSLGPSHDSASQASFVGARCCN